nr:trypsin-1-like [Drosophila bipectinata]
MCNSKLCVYIIFIMQILLVDISGSGESSALVTSGTSSELAFNAGNPQSSNTTNEGGLAVKATTAKHSDFLRAPLMEPRESNLDSDSDSDSAEFNYLITGGATTGDRTLVRYAVWFAYRGTRAQFGDNIISGGLIVHKQFVLTSAHSLFLSPQQTREPSDLQAVAGAIRRLESTDATISIMAKAFFVHPGYRHPGVTNDLALVLLEREFDLSPAVAIARIPTYAAYDGMSCTVVGWGAVVDQGPIADEYLEAKVVTHQSSCSMLRGWDNIAMLCARDAAFFEVDACLYDSGTPMFCDGNYAFGLVAYGLGCGNPDHGGAYMNLHHYSGFFTNDRMNNLLYKFMGSRGPGPIRPLFWPVSDLYYSKFMALLFIYYIFVNYIV